MRTLEDMTAEERKQYPITTGLLDYFPNACAYVAHVSKVANEQHNPGEPMHWAKDKSIGVGDQVTRHWVDRYTIDKDNLLHAGKAAWRALEFLERLLVVGWPDRPAMGFPDLEAASWDRGLDEEIGTNTMSPYLIEGDGWIEWIGGPCPVHPDTLVEIRVREGDEYVEAARLLRWDHMPADDIHYPRDIIAYKVVGEIRDRTIEIGY